MAKGYTDFFAGFFGAEAVATKPIDAVKYMDWDKVKEIVANNPDSVIYAGLREDWDNTSGLIYAKGNYYDGYVYGESIWATPIVDVDGDEIEVFKMEPNAFTHKPDWWGNGHALLSDCDFFDEE